MLGYLSMDITCSSKLTVFLELYSSKTVGFLEQITSTPNGGYCLYMLDNSSQIAENQFDSAYPINYLVCYIILS